MGMAASRISNLFQVKWGLIEMFRSSYSIYFISYYCMCISLSLSRSLSLSMYIYIYTGVPCKECILKIRFSLNFSSSTRTSYHVETWMCHPALTLIFFCVGPVFPGSSHLPEKRHVGKLHKLQTWVWVSKVGWFWLAGPQLQSTSSKWPWMTVISNIESSKFSSADQVGVVQVRRSLPWPLVRSFCAAFIWIPLKCPQQNSLSSTNLQGRGHGLELCLNDCGSDHAEQVSCVENVCVLCVCGVCVCVSVCFQKPTSGVLSINAHPESIFHWLQ